MCAPLLSWSGCSSLSPRSSGRCSPGLGGGDMLDDLTMIAGTFFDTLTGVFTLYTSSQLLSGALALWFLYKVIKIFRRI